MGDGPKVVQARAPYAFARALAATVVVVTGAVSAHTWAGGTVPTGPGLALVSAVVLAGGLLVFIRSVPLWALLPAVGAALAAARNEPVERVAETTRNNALAFFWPA